MTEHTPKPKRDPRMNPTAYELMEAMAEAEAFEEELVPLRKLTERQYPVSPNSWGLKS